MTSIRNAQAENYRKLGRRLKDEYEGGWISKESYLTRMHELRKEYERQKESRQ